MHQEVHCINPVTNISFVACQFIGNVVSELISVKLKFCKCNLLIIGPIHVTNTIHGSYHSSKIISIDNMAVDVIGPVIMSLNSGRTIMFFDNCDIKFYNNITYKSNIRLHQIIYLKYSYIQLTKHTSITFLKNHYTHIDKN